jgi:hypothetical protein
MLDPAVLTTGRLQFPGLLLLVDFSSVPLIAYHMTSRQRCTAVPTSPTGFTSVPDQAPWRAHSVTNNQGLAKQHSLNPIN